MSTGANLTVISACNFPLPNNNPKRCGAFRIVVMNNEWKLREEIYQLGQKWPQIMLFFLIGALLGWGITFFLPSPHRAEASVHVSFNGDVYPRNPDDFKNWQLQELEVLITSKELLRETLIRLRKEDKYWNGVDVQSLKEDLSVYWRNAGEWRLVAEAPTPERASNLAQVWQQVILEEVKLALVHAQNMLTIDAQINATSDAQIETGSMITELSTIKGTLLTWQETAAQAGLDQSLTTMERWNLLLLVTRIVRLDTGGQALLEQAPLPGAPVEDYINWSNQALVLLEQELANLQTQAEALTSQQENLNNAWSAEFKASQGLSAYLMITALPSDNSQPYAVRPATQTALIGGTIGLLLWGLVWLARPHLRTKR